MAPQMVTALRKSEVMNDGAQFEETRPVWNHDLSGPVDKVIDGGIICFNRLKNARRVAPRYAKLAATFLPSFSSPPCASGYATLSTGSNSGPLSGDRIRNSGTRSFVSRAAA
jgi:hypothetical protein